MSRDDEKDDVDVRRGPSRKRSKNQTDSVPRRDHDTRVNFRFKCCECGASASLDYVPKNKSIDELLCETCLEQDRDSESRWAQVRRQKQRETRDEWPINCAECGREDHVPFEPEPDEDYYCKRCFEELEDEEDETSSESRETTEGERVYIRLDENA